MRWRLLRPTGALGAPAAALFRQRHASCGAVIVGSSINLRTMFADKDLKATVTKKIALCNKQLGLAERDGLKGD